MDLPQTLALPRAKQESAPGRSARSPVVQGRRLARVGADDRIHEIAAAFGADKRRVGGARVN
jgi:hypothetical protein